MATDMEVQNQVTVAVYAAIDELNSQFPKPKVEKSAETILFGKGGSLDSLGLINLIVIAEKHLEEALRTCITLADERAMSQRNSPFRSVGTLISYVCTIVKEPAHA